MAKKQATKAPIKVTGGAKRHPPAMYPTPAPLKLATPQKIVAIDPETIAIEGSVSPEEFAAIAAGLETERRRLNLTERIAGYTRVLAKRIAPHWGERPKHISLAKWRNLEQRIKAMAELPENAPAEAHDALLALHTLNRLVSELVETGDYPDSVDRALCFAIDLGQLLQRSQGQIDFGKAVDIERKSAKVRPLGPQKVSADAKDRTKLIRQRFIEIRNEGILKGQQDIIDKMLAPKTLTDGKGNMTQDQPKLPDGSDMPARSTIEKATVGLTPRKSPTQSKRK